LVKSIEYTKKEKYGNLLFLRFKGRLLGAPTDGVDSLVYPYTMMTAMMMMAIGKKEKLGEIFQLSCYRELEIDTEPLVVEVDEKNSIEGITSEEIGDYNDVEMDEIYEVTDIKNDIMLRKVVKYLQEYEYQFNLKKRESDYSSIEGDVSGI